MEDHDGGVSLSLRMNQQTRTVWVQGKPVALGAANAILVDLVDSRPNDPHWIEFNRRFNVFAAQFGARPLLNQTKQLSRDVVHQTLGNDWEQLLPYREQNDPDGRFLSKFFRDLI